VNIQSRIKRFRPKETEQSADDNAADFLEKLRPGGPWDDASACDTCKKMPIAVMYRL
jgi:hypothetical protein